jgi:hypothetical protein
MALGDSLEFRVSAEIRDAIAKFQELATRADELDRKLQALDGADVDPDLALEVAQFDADLDRAQRRLQDVSNGRAEARVDVTVDDTELDTARTDIGALDRTARVDVQVDDAQLDTARTRTNELDGETVRVDVSVDDSKLDTAIRKANELDGRSVTVDVNTRGGPGGDGDASGGGELGAGDLAGIGAVARGGAAGLGGAAVGKFFADSTLNAKELALQVQTVADITGDSLDTASRLVAVWQAAGYDTAELIDLIGQMNQTLADSPELADRLKVNLNDGAGLGARFIEVVGALNTEISDVGERGRVASQVFGEEGLRQTSEIRTRVGDLSRAVSDVPQAQIIDEADVQRARELDQRLRGINRWIENIKLQFGQGVAELVNDPAGSIPRSLASRFTSSTNPILNLLGLGGSSQPQPPTATAARPLTTAEIERLLARSAGNEITNYYQSTYNQVVGQDATVTRSQLREDELRNGPR